MKNLLYRNEVWLRDQYLSKNRTSSNIAIECDVNFATVCKWLHIHNIPIKPYSESHKASLETREKMSKARLGKDPWNKNKRTGLIPSNKGKHLTEEEKNNLPESVKKCWFKKGQIPWNWQGGISFEPYCPKWNRNLRKRIRNFYKNECILCGKSKLDNKEELSCHHVEYNKQACCDGKPVHFASLCRSCHAKTTSSSSENRQRYLDMIHRIIYEVYDGKSYYTKDEWELVK